MASIIVPSRRIWTRQPLRLADIDLDNPIDLGHPLSEGLISLVLPSVGLDLARRRFIRDAAASSGVQYSGFGNAIPGPGGLRRTSNAGNSFLWVTKPDVDPNGWGPFQLTGQGSMMAVVAFPNGGSYSTSSLGGYSTNGYGLSIRYSNAVPYHLWAGVRIEGPKSMVDGRPHITGFSADGSTLTGFLDGRAYGSIAAGASPTYTGFGGYDGFQIDNKVYLLGVWSRALKQSDHATNPFSMIRARVRRTFVDFGSSNSLNASALGSGQASGQASLAAQVSLAAVGVAVSNGTAQAAVSIPLSAAGFSISSASVNAEAVVTISAAALAQAAGQAGLSAGVLIAAAAAAQAAGNAQLAAQIHAIAAGATQSSGSATLTGNADLAAIGVDASAGQASISLTVSLLAIGAGVASGSASPNLLSQGGISADGKAVATGTAIPILRVELQAEGHAQAAGTADIDKQTAGQITAIGHAQASGNAGCTVTAALTAAGFVQAMGAGQIAIEIPLSAIGSSTTSGAAHLSAIPDYTPVAPLSLAAIIKRPTKLHSLPQRIIKLHHKVHRAHR